VGSVGIGSLLKIALMPYSFSCEWSLSLGKKRRPGQRIKKKPAHWPACFELIVLCNNSKKYKYDNMERNAHRLTLHSPAEESLRQVQHQVLDVDQLLPV